VAILKVLAPARGSLAMLHKVVQDEEEEEEDEAGEQQQQTAAKPGAVPALSLAQVGTSACARLRVNKGMRFPVDRGAACIPVLSHMLFCPCPCQALLGSQQQATAATARSSVLATARGVQVDFGTPRAPAGLLVAPQVG
jgi:hypothetical protein